MKILVLVSLLTFLSYYFACLQVENNKKKIFIFFFIIFSVILRSILHTNLNNDYYLYYDFRIFHKPNGFLSFLLNEPYLYSVYSFFNIFLESKVNVFLGIYWFNFLISSIFFIWILTRNDIEMIKKMILFTFHYFIFGFVVLRNGPAYILFAIYFYHAFRDKKFNWVLITPLMHISSSLMLVTYFYKLKNYYKILVLIPIVIISFFLIFKTYLRNIGAFDSILSKIDIYSQGMVVIGFMHKVFFVLIWILVIIGFVLYKKKMLHPIIITTLFIYSISFFINPVVAHRFSPYLFFALLLGPFVTTKNEKMLALCNRLSILLFPIFLYTLFLTHKNNLFLGIL